MIKAVYFKVENKNEKHTKSVVNIKSAIGKNQNLCTKIIKQNIISKNR